MQRPILRLNQGQGRRLRAGSPWVFSNEIAMQPEYRQMPPGELVQLQADDGTRLGTFMFNPHSLIAGRLLDRDPTAAIDLDWLRTRLREAIMLRERVCDTPFHRLVHAEADRLPGLVIDRYDDVVVLQANTAGMDRLTPLIVEALTALLPLRAIVARNDSAARRQEGLAEGVALLWGTDANAHVLEANVRFPVDPLGGQKTGWYLDQRPNRDRVAALANGARVLDVFCHVGAFGLRCAAAGAREVTLLDSSAPALAQAEQAAALNGVADRVQVRRGDAFDAMTALAGEHFDIVVCDPPAFARSRKDADAGLRAYSRMARLAAPLVAPGGFLLVASCSHHAPLEAWAGQIAFGLHRARREGRILFTGGAGPDHPVHPHLPETAYLKTQLIQLLYVPRSMRAFSTGAFAASIILGLLTLLLWLAMLATLADFGSSDAAGNALAQGFAAIEIIVVWLLLTVLVGIAAWKGNTPSGTALTAVLLLALSGVAACLALDLLVHRHTPPHLWPIVTPALVPPLVLAFCFWALLPSLHTLVAPRVALIGTWGSVLILCIVIWPMMQIRDRALAQQDAERAKWSAAFADVAADAPLWDWTPFLLAPDYRIVDNAVATIRNLPRRQDEAEAMLDRGDFPLRYLGEFDLDPTPSLCEKARAQLRRSVPSAASARPYAEIADAADAAITAMEWLVGHGCACDAEAQAWEAVAQQHRDIGYDQYRLAALRDPKALGRRMLESPERFSMLTPQSHLKAWLRFADDASLREQVLAGARQLDHRTDDAVEMLNQDSYAASAVLHYLPRLDLDATEGLCAAGLTALYERLTAIYRPLPDDPRPYSELLARLGVDAPLTALQWLASHGCDADGALDEAVALAGAYQDSPERTAMLDSLQQLHRRP